jgi:hypothetical protein
MSITSGAGSIARHGKYAGMDADMLTREINALLVTYPELADDEQLMADMMHTKLQEKVFINVMKGRREDEKKRMKTT